MYRHVLPPIPLKQQYLRFENTFTVSALSFPHRIHGLNPYDLNPEIRRKLSLKRDALVAVVAEGTLGALTLGQQILRLGKRPVVLGIYNVAASLSIDVKNEQQKV